MADFYLLAHKEKLHIDKRFTSHGGGHVMWMYTYICCLPCGLTSRFIWHQLSSHQVDIFFSFCLSTLFSAFQFFFPLLSNLQVGNFHRIISTSWKVSFLFLFCLFYEQRISLGWIIYKSRVHKLPPIRALV